MVTWARSLSLSAIATMEASTNPKKLQMKKLGAARDISLGQVLSGNLARSQRLDKLLRLRRPARFPMR